MKNERKFLGGRSFFMAGALAVVICLGAAASAASFTLEQVMSSPFPSNLVAASRSGRVAWIFDAEGARNVWVADTPDFAAHQVTQYAGDDGEPLASLRITPDGRTLVYVRGSELNESGRVADPTSGVWERKQQVWAVDVGGGAPRLLGEMGCPEEGCEDVELSPDGQFAVWAARKQLWVAPVSGATPAHQLTGLRGNNFSPRWSPDGRQIAFVSDRGDHSFIAIYDFGRDNVRYLAPSADRDVMPRWSPDGRRIVFVRLPGVREKLPLIPERPTPWAIWVADAASGEGKEIWHSGETANDSFPELTADVSFNFPSNDRLLFASEQDGWNHLYSMPAAGGTPTLLTPGKFEVEDVALSADRHSVLYSSNQDDVDRRHIWRVGLEGDKPQALTRGETIEWNPVETGQGGQVVCLGSAATSPAMPYRITAQGREMIAASALPPDFPAKQLVTPKQVIFKSEDGLEIHGQLFVPVGRNQAGPALIFMHGGPIRQMVLGFHYMDYYHYAYAMNEYLASQGYVVLSVNYRLGIMYGRAFREPANACWRGASEYKDVLAGAKYLRTLSIVDAKRIGLWGGSYGGFLTALGLARNSDLFAAGVDMHGVHDWSVFLPRWENHPEAPDAKEAEKLAFESSPDASIATWKSPVLLIQGDDDRNVPFGQTVDLAQRLREAHVRFEELVFPDEIHGFLMWKSWIKAYTATAEFFDRMLKGGGSQ
ncbi:MAG TPA: prolyl oligopeptidase family serine peptidase [Terriglobales bacterium]|nr:prolyl oligopeptidase family serine peptidase [Terriglobales bacterium]